MLTSLLTVIVVLVVLGGVMYLIEQPSTPIAPAFKMAIRVILIIGLIVWLIYFLGGYIPRPTPR